VTERVWGPNDLRLVAVWHKLAGSMSACNRGADAIHVLERVATLHDYYGAETAEVVSDLRNLAAALQQQSRPRHAALPGTCVGNREAPQG
jgi:hypothetical protein